uniref:Peptidoglycan-recognition protein n=1 Tax=Sinohyriopsis cumingii TaxID=165450 RepID=W8GP21_SINCU|nr:peptidoglycan recognition protein S2 [Sinohyriopsis cumingii]
MFQSSFRRLELNCHEPEEITMWLLFLVTLCVLSCEGRPRDIKCNVTLVTREEWHARPTRHTEHMNTPVGIVFIHHTAMAECDDQHSCTVEMQKIQNFHMDIRSWDDIGYNFLIGGDGRVYEARGWDRVGAHTRGWNDVAVAFSVMGDYTNKLPNSAALTAVHNIIDCGILKGKITPDYKMYGHRNAGTTECPGQQLYDLIRTWPHFDPNKPVRPTPAS